MLKEKILEKAQDIIGVKGKHEIIREVADLLYFITGILAKNNIDMSDLFIELRRCRYENKKGG